MKAATYAAKDFKPRLAADGLPELPDTMNPPRPEPPAPAAPEPAAKSKPPRDPWSPIEVACLAVIVSPFVAAWFVIVLAEIVKFYLVRGL